MRLALNPPCSEPTGDAIMEGSPPAGDGAELLGPITQEDVVVALHTLKSYRAAGYSGCPMELLKYAIVPEDDSGTPVASAEDIDVPRHLAVMLDMSFDGGSVPAQWKWLLVSPVFKRGNWGDQADYRPIAVSDIFSKLYAVVLHNRLLPWLER